MTHAIALPVELTIYKVGELLPELRDWASMDGGGTWRLQASAVEEVDAAGIQLLLSLARTAQAQAQQLSLVDASPVLSQACQALGVADLMNWASGGDDDAH